MTTPWRPEIHWRNPESLTPYARNAAVHSNEQLDELAGLIAANGFTQPIVVDKEGVIVVGHGRREAALRLGMGEVPVVVADHLDEHQLMAYRIADNKIGERRTWDAEMLKFDLGSLKLRDFDMKLTGVPLPELTTLLPGDSADGAPAPSSGPGVDPNAPPATAAKTLAERFLVPPFSVLDARQGYWKTRKDEWLALGIQSELGRGAESYQSQDKLKALMDQKKSHSGVLHTGETGREHGEEYVGGDAWAGSGTSIFDPVLCELAYRWFSPADGVVLDPFAGGSVRGVVASKLGRKYVGVELRPEQVAANQEQGEQLCAGNIPTWHAGDSRNVQELCAGVEADLVFSCPPYADLEVYSDDPADLSTLDYSAFRDEYAGIIDAACELLKPNRFACFVVGEVRDKKGNYIGLVPDTIRAFEAAGLHFYNEAILVTSAGSLPIRARRPFEGSRKLGKTHQNVLVFVKGDAKLAAEACGLVDANFELPGGPVGAVAAGEQL